MAQALDYSAGFPGAVQIKLAGYTGAVRYIGFPDRRKCTTRLELEDYTRHGIGMALVYQDGTGDWTGGYSAGKISAHRARQHANQIGFPAGRPIYFAIDRDVVTANEFGAVIAYLSGAASVLGADLVGVYGEADVVDRARAVGAAAWFWQTKAWSRGRLVSAHLRQLIGTVHVGGIACDVNDLLVADWGQHNYVAVRKDNAVKNLILGKKGDAVWVGDGLSRRHVADEVELGGLQHWIGVKGGDATIHDFEDLRVLGAPIAAGVAVLADDEQMILEAIAAGGVADPAAFAAILAPILGPMVEAGLTIDEARSAADDAIRSAFTRGGDEDPVGV